MREELHFPQLSVKEDLTIAALTQISKRPTIHKRMGRFVWNENVKKLEIPAELMDQPIRKAEYSSPMKLDWLYGVLIL